jgi:F0F1-type ATP synthase membrane subunit b/b'
MTLAKLIPLIVLQVGIIVAIVLFIRRFLIRNVTRVTTHLDRMGEDFTKKQEEAARHLRKAEQESDRILAEARQEAEGIREKTLEQAREEGEEIVRKARVEGERVVSEATRTKEFLMSEMDQKIREEAVGVAGEMVSRVLSEDVRRDAHARRISDLLSGGLEGFEGIDVPDGTQVRITSAFDLTVEQSGVLKGELRERLGPDVQFVEETNPDLIAGAVIGVGDLIVDGSLRYSIEEAARDVRRSAGG